jgi:hypothetical protein
MSHPEVMDMINEIHSAELQQLALLSIIDESIRRRQIEQAEVYLLELRNLNNGNEELQQDIKWRSAEILAARNEISSLQEIMEGLHVKTRYHELLYLYFEALISEHNKE